MKISIEPTRDFPWMWSVATHPGIHRQIGGKPETMDVEKCKMQEVVRWPSNRFFAVKQDGVRVGFFAYHETGERKFDLHICILPNARGLVAREGFRLSIMAIVEAGARWITAVFDPVRKDVATFCRWGGFRKQGPGFYILERV